MISIFNEISSSLPSLVIKQWEEDFLFSNLTFITMVQIIYGERFVGFMNLDSLIVNVNIDIIFPPDNFQV